ncbi:MAG: DUF1844 domain-containing protein [Balneolales bacterium]
MAERDNEKVNFEQQDQVLFLMLVQQHQQIAMMGLGQQENPSTGKKEKDLKAVKYSIDTLTMLEKYTAGNLSKEMADYLSETLKNLRLQYVNANKSDGADE